MWDECTGWDYWRPRCTYRCAAEAGLGAEITKDPLLRISYLGSPQGGSHTLDLLIIGGSHNIPPPLLKVRAEAMRTNASAAPKGVNITPLFR